MDKLDQYSIRTFWSEEDGSFIAVCSEFPSLSATGESRVEATTEMHSLLEFVIADMEREGKPVPGPSAARALKGNIALRIDPLVHRRVLTIAEESGRSMNQTLGLLISLGIEKYFQHDESHFPRLYQG